ncbi:hypothetical protein [Tumebacillus lipolyticus]|uniref:Uncharacterized protein n=1 Tax=Tumebacillus lipolyticus TaxID=1280370 RepID=A0ABW5A0T1_9BACL
MKHLGSGKQHEFDAFLNSQGAQSQKQDLLEDSLLESGGSDWECYEVDPSYGDPQGDCVASNGQQGVWRVMYCTWRMPDGSTKVKRSAWCSKLYDV